jgi:hypothetical protein
LEKRVARRSVLADRTVFPVHRGEPTEMNVAYRGRAAYLPDTATLVVADLHVGRASASDVDAPLGAHDGVVDRIVGHLEAVDAETVVVAGDVLHVHGTVPRGALDVLAGLASAVAAAESDLVLVRGNHDTLLDRLDLPADVSVVDEHRLADGTVVCHGHEEPELEAPRYLVGHDHPAIRVEGARHPCFLVGDGVFRSSDVLVLPAFSRLASGTLVNGLGAGMSPLVPALGAFRPVVVGEEAFEFPPLAEFATLL